MLLKVQGVVRLARDVEVKYTQEGKAIANFSVVSSNKYTTQSGEKKEDVCFIEATAFGRLGEICNHYLRKGSQIKIDGELKLDQWTAQDGSKKSKHSVIIKEMEMLGGREDNQQPPPKQGYTTQHEDAQGNVIKTEQHQGGSIPEINIDEDAIPFAPLRGNYVFCI